MVARSMSQIRAQVEAEYRRTGRIAGERPSGNVRHAIQAEADRRWDWQREGREGAAEGFFSRVGRGADRLGFDQVARGAHRSARIAAGEEDFQLFGGRVAEASTPSNLDPLRRLQQDHHSMIRGVQEGVRQAGPVAAAGGFDSEMQSILDQLKTTQNAGQPVRHGGLFGGGDSGVFIESRTRTSRVPAHIAVKTGQGEREVQEGVNIPTPFHEQLNQNEMRFLPIVIEMAQKHGIEPGLLFGLIKTESNFNPSAINRANSNGTVDYGISQINSSVLQGMGKTPEWANNPRNAIDYTAGRLAAAIAKYGSTTAALIEYNGGAGRADKFMESGNWPYAAAESYVSRILTVASEFNPNQHWELDGPEPREPIPNLPIQLASTEDVKSAAKEIGRKVLGRFPDEQELPRIVSMVHDLQRGEQTRDFQSEMAGMQASQPGALGFGGPGGSIAPANAWTPEQIGSAGQAIAEAFGGQSLGQWRDPSQRSGPGRDPNSDHLDGYAFDIQAPTHEQMLAIEAWAKQHVGPGKPFRNVVYSGDKHHEGHHVHISWWNPNSGQANRRPTPESATAPIALPGSGGAQIAPNGSEGGIPTPGVQPGVDGSDPFVTHDVFGGSSIEDAISRHLEEMFPEEAGAKKFMDQGEQFLQIIGVR